MIIKIKNSFLAVILSIGFVSIFMYELINGSGIELILRLCVLLITAFTIVKGLQEKSYINPYLLFSLVPISLLIYSETVSSYFLMKLDPETWIIAIINMASFLTALSLYKNHTRHSCVKTVEEHVNNYVLDAVVLFIIGKLPWLTKLLIGRNFFLASVLPFCNYASIICALCSRNRKCIFGITILNVIFLLINGFNKTSILFLAFSYIIGYEKYYVTDKRKMKKLLIILIVAVVLFIFIIFPLRDYLRAGGEVINFIFSDFNGNGSNYYQGRIIWEMNSNLMMPYMYFVTPWTNLQYVMQTQNSRTYGLWMIKPLLGYLQIDERFRELYAMHPYSTFNTFTYIAVLFKDFGFALSGIGSAVLGVFVGWVYKKKYLGTHSPFDVICYAMTAVATFEMFFSNHFFKESYPFTVILLMLIYTRLVRQSLHKLV